MSDRLLPGWVAITDKEGDTVHIAPGVTYHPNSDTPYQGGKQGAIIAVAAWVLFVAVMEWRKGRL